MLQDTLKTNHVLILAFNLLLMTIAGYFVEVWTGIVDTPRYGIVRLIFVCAYMIYLVSVAYKSLVKSQEHSDDELNARIEELEIENAEYEDAIGESVNALDAMAAQTDAQAKKIDAYEKSIMHERKESKRLALLVQEKNTAIEDFESKTSLLKSQNDEMRSKVAVMQDLEHELTQSSRDIASLSESNKALKLKLQAVTSELDEIKQAEEERAKEASERARKAAQARYSKKEQTQDA